MTQVPNSMLAGPTVVPYSTVIPLDTAAFGKKILETQLAAASAFTVGANPIPDGTCTFCLIGDGNPAHVPDFSAFGAANAYVYSSTLGARNIYLAVYEFSTPTICGYLGLPATVSVAVTLLSATAANATPGRINCVWSGAVNSVIAAPGAFSTVGHPLTAHTFDGPTTTHIDTSTPFVFGEAARFLSFDNSVSPMTGTNGLPVASFAAFPITNGVLQSSITDSNGAQPTERPAKADSASSLGSTTTGQAWTAHTGTWGVKGNLLYLVTQAGDSVATFDSGLADVDLSADITPYGDCGIVYRTTNDQNYWLVLLEPDNVTLHLYKRVAGAYTVAGTATWAHSNGIAYNIRVDAVGSVHNVYVDGALMIGPITDGALSTNTRVGIRQNDGNPSRWGNILAKAHGSATSRRVATWAGAIESPGILRADVSSQKSFIGWGNPSKEGGTLAVGDQWGRFKTLATPPTPINIILDTDCSTDVDDFMDCKAALVYHTEGLANVLGIAVTTSRDKSPGAIAALLQFYGNSTIPVASYAPLGTFDPGTDGTFINTVYANYAHVGYGLASTVMDTTTAIGSWLTSSTGNVVYVMTGFAKGLRAYLQSTGGSTLFASKVTKVIVVAGKYPNDGGTPEFNFAQNAADWNWLNANCPVPLVFAGIEIGTAVGAVGGTYLTTRQSLPDVMLYALNDYNAQHAIGSPSETPWGLMGLMAAVEGTSRYFNTVVGGVNAIDAGTGSNTFTAGAGTSSYLTINRAAAIALYANSLVAADVKAGLKTWNGSAWV